MTDKEQIIIDGVDITSCCHRKNNLCSCPHYKKECTRNPNCHFKIVERQRKKIDKFYRKELELCQQLARKTQECEELKSKNSILKNSLKPFQDEYFKNLETIVIASLAKKSIRITAENTQLRKALEEIEDICNVADRYELEELQETIFNIINKAKGENNGISDNSK